MHEEEIRERYWENGEAQMLLRSLARLGKGHQLVHIEDIKDDYDEAEGCDMETTKVKDLLRIFVDKALIAKEGKAWKVRDVYWLRLFMNDDHGVVPDEVDLLSDDLDESSCASMKGDDVLVEQVGLSFHRMVSHVSQGTRDSPICIDCSGGSVSSVSVSAVSSRNGERARLSPQKNQLKILGRNTSLTKGLQDNLTENFTLAPLRDILHMHRCGKWFMMTKMRKNTTRMI